MRGATSRVGTSYVMLFTSMLGFLVGMGLLDYGWPRPCGGVSYFPFYTNCGVSYWVDIFGILIIAISVGVMAYSIRNHAH